MKTFIYIGTSIDGFIAREDGDIDWLVKYDSPEVNESFTEYMNNIDAIVMGRATFEKVLSFQNWPYDKKVFVLSSSLNNIPDHLQGKAEIISMRPKVVLNFLSSSGFTNIYVDGGKVIQEFLREDCIDEMIITRVPVLIGNGIPLFGFLQKDLNFEHIETKVYSSGLVKSHYRRVK
jgi:dihydrofolate reductase